MNKRNLLIGILSLIILIPTHWFAYSRGKKQGDEEWFAVRDQKMAEGQFRQLRASVSILRAMAAHPDRFSPAEIMGARVKSNNALIGGEKIALRYFKKIGDEKRAQEAQSLLQQGRELQSKLPK